MNEVVVGRGNPFGTSSGVQALLDDGFSGPLQTMHGK